jgi:hypothetical protein
MSDLSDFIRRVYEPETKALQEKLLRAEREIAAGNEKHLVLWRRWQDAEARAQKAEAERDVAREFAAEKQTSLVRHWREQAQKAEAVVEAARKVQHEYDLWAEDANDGEFAIWSRDEFMAAFHGLRLAFNALSVDEPPTSCDGSVNCAAEKHTIGCYRSTPADEPPTGEGGVT